MKYSLLSIYLLFIISISCTTERKVPVYDVNYFNKYNIILDGMPDDSVWGESVMLKDFRLPWSDSTPSATVFQALYDSSTLYIFYKAEDQNLVIKDSINNEIDIASEDRVELYLSKDNTMKEYFCLEIDPLGRILDYTASFYRKFNNEWDIKGIKVASKINSKNYHIEVAIPLKSIAEMGIDISKDFYVGLFRADFKNTVSGKEENWLSWIDPGIPNPDFHVPKALGLFHFVQH